MKKKKYKGGGYLPKYNIGGIVGMGLGAVGGSFAGNPMLGAKVGGMLGGGVGEALEDNPIKPNPLMVGTDLGLAHGGLVPIGQNALAVKGSSHENGGVKAMGVEMEGGETVDFIKFQNGGMIDSRDGSPYVFSKRLKLPDSSATFAQAHKRLVDKGANEDEIRKLATLQEKVSGRASEPKTSSQVQKDFESKEAKYKARMERMRQGDFSDVMEDEKAYGGEVKMQMGGDPPWWKNIFGNQTPPTRGPANYYVDPSGQATGHLPNEPSPTGGTKRPGGAQFQSGPQGTTLSGKPVKTPGTAVERSLNTVHTKSPLRRLLNPTNVMAAFLPKSFADSEGFQKRVEDTRKTLWGEKDQEAPEGNQGGEGPLKRINPLGEGYDFTDFGINTPFIDGVKPTSQSEASGESPESSDPVPSRSGVGPRESESSPSFGPGVDSANPDSLSTLGNQEIGPLEKATMSGEDAVKGYNALSGESGGEEGGFSGEDALQFLPDIMNFATGAFGDGNTPPPTRVNDRSAQNFETQINVNPQLQKNAAAYRAIINDPNASPQQKLAAQAQKQAADSAVYADKVNRETQLKANKSRIQSSLDRHNAQFKNQARSERMKADAMFGPTGNMARGAVASSAQKLLMKQAMENREDEDKRATLAVISQLDPALQKKYAKQLGL